MIKVLAELVEHHIEEEEEDMLPDFKKEIDAETRMSLGAKYLQLKDKFESMGGDEAPPEKTIKENEQAQVHH